uniref:Amidoligase enzyme n=1 Tax=Aplanochytrium stocchinoi TaxID=215587 RepID=A0A7S3PQH9_9STRA
MRMNRVIFQDGISKTFKHDLEQRKYVSTSNERIQLRDRIVVARHSATPERNFGVEFELTLQPNNRIRDLDDLVTHINQCGIACRRTRYSDKEPTPYWKVLVDSSISCPRGSSGCLTFELVSPILKGSEGLQEVSKCLHAINQLDPQASKSAGFHVHIEVDRHDVVSLKKILQQFIKYEKVFDSLMPPSRRADANKYCKSLRKHYHYMTSKAINTAIANMSSIDELMDFANPQQSRYFKLNLQPLDRQPTIEFRQHPSTYTYKKAGAWIRLLLHFVENSSKFDKPASFKENTSPQKEFDRFFQWVIKDRWLFDFYAERRKKMLRKNDNETSQTHGSACCQGCSSGEGCWSK